MSDWSSLASGDPVPGDRGAMATLARCLDTTAEVVRTQADRLVGIDPGCWEGEAASEFRTRQGELAPKLGTVPQRYERAALAPWTRWQAPATGWWPASTPPTIRPWPPGGWTRAPTSSRALTTSSPGRRHSTPVPLNDELLLVQHFDQAGGGIRKWWTSLEEANRMSTVDDVHQRLALLPEWGQRNAVRVVHIPPREDVAFLCGRTAPQTGRIGATAGAHFAGGGEQFRLLEFDEAWVVASRAIP